ncbi:S8 family peptidase [Nitratireductor thuwali]|uniref:Extracellular serine protease n=1 Tax=Nitratireductor thuwali TaxID=2267699 RepID=A0ABY5ME78_9HYPH|nr:Extracellular serine protease [Nitratireductor thuwali]
MLGKDYASPVGRASALVLILGSILQTPPAFAEPLRGSTGDPEADFNWGLSAVNAKKAHQAGFTGKGVRVGVFDSGLDITHPEFSGRVGPDSLDIEASLLAGKPIPVSGDEEGHGTFVSGIIAANRDGQGTQGIAYGASLVPLAGDIGPDTFNVQTYFAFTYFASRGGEIVNASLGVDESDAPGGVADRAYLETQFPDAISAVREAARVGVVTVWAAGNEAADNAEAMARLPYYYPELEDTSLAVVALAHSGGLASYSSKCGVATAWCLAAPGGEGDIGDPEGVSSVASGGYMTAAGTSFAAPHVTGGLAIAREIFPDADMGDLRKLILHTAVDIGEPGVDATFGWGRLDLGNVVETIAPYGRSIFAGAAFSRRLSMEQVARLPSGPVARSQRLRRLWAAGDLVFAGIDADTDAGGLPQTKARSRTLAAGLDLIERGWLTAGLGLAYTNGATSEKSTVNTATANGFHGFGYGDWAGGAWYAKGAAGVSYFRQEHERRTIPGLAGTVLALGGPEARSSSDVWGVFADAEAGRNFDLGLAGMAVFGRFTGAVQSYGATSESGLEVLGYDLLSGTVSSAQVGPGVRFSRPFTRGAWMVAPELDLSYARVLGSSDYAVRTALLGREMEARTAALGRDVFGVGAKLTFEQPERGFTASVGYSGSFRERATQHAVRLSLSVKF